MKLKKKLILYNTAAVVLTLLLAGFAVIYEIQQLSIRTLERQLIDQSRLAEIYITQLHILENGASDEINIATSQNAISNLGLALGNVRIYDKALNLQAASKDYTSGLLSEEENQELLRTALKGSYAYIIRNSTAYFASPIYFKEGTLGVFEIIYPMGSYRELLTGVIDILIMGALIFSLFVALLAAAIAGRLTKPIHRLAEAARQFANRNFTPVEIKSNDEIAHLSQSFNQMGRELQDYIQKQRQFTANVSHELRTPLTAIKGYSEYLMDEVGEREDLVKAVTHLKNESERLEKLVNEVLTLSRIEMDREILHFERIDLSRLAKETSDRMLLRAEKYGINLQTRIEPGVYVLGDMDKLIQVLLNLLDNAFKYSKSGSSVQIKLLAKEEQAVLSVEDQGIGIPDKLTSRVIKICDVFDALTNQRVYRNIAYTIDETLDIMENMKSEFDPNLFKEFINFIRRKNNFLFKNHEFNALKVNN